MKLEKKKRLETAGWRVGTVSEFLGLTDEETALIELKLDLAKAEALRRSPVFIATPSGDLLHARSGVL